MKIYEMQHNAANFKKSNLAQNSKMQDSLSFGRALKEYNPSTGVNEVRECRQVVRRALTALDKKNVAIVMHGPCFPQVAAEDTGMGSPYTKGAAKLMRFFSQFGINSIQFGPEGKLEKGCPSPYQSRSLSSNTLFINLPDLAGKKWADILSKKTLNEVANNHDGRSFENRIHNMPASRNYVDYGHIFDNQEKALVEAFDNFKAKREEENPEILRIQKKFEDFQLKNKNWVERDALYETLLQEHKEDPKVIETGVNSYVNWNSDIDRNLFKYLDNPDHDKHEEALKRKEELQSRDDVEYYKFCQFVAADQKQEMRKVAKENGITTMADREVAFSDCDVWANQEAFIPKLSLGCPDGQSWEFPVINPDKLFERKNGKIKQDKNGNPVLGPAGNLMRASFDKMFSENPGGVRIDHVIGLIDPWVYPQGEKSTVPEAGRLLTSPENKMLKDWAKVGLEDIDSNAPKDAMYRIKKETFDNNPKKLERYAEVIEKIVIPSAKANGVPVENIICEDIGALTAPVVKILDKLNLSGIRNTRWGNPHNDQDPYRAKNLDPKHWATTGTHDDDTLAHWVHDMINRGEADSQRKMLAEDLTPKDISNRELKKAELEHKIKVNPKEFLNAKVAEIFAAPSKNIQVFFGDLFGIEERYNKPGTPADQNWKVRVPNDFDKYFYKQMEKDNGINIPKALKTALESKGSAYIKENRLEQVINKLDEYAEILKEEEFEIKR